MKILARTYSGLVSLFVLTLFGGFGFVASAQEGCQQSIALTSVSVGCGGVVTATVQCTGDSVSGWNADDVLIYVNGDVRPTADAGPGTLVSSDLAGCNVTSWGPVQFGGSGVALVTAYSSQMNLTSGAATVTVKGSGVIWSYAMGGILACGFQMPIKVACVPPEHYQVYETPGSEILLNGNVVLNITMTDYPGDSVTVAPGGSINIPDAIAYACNSGNGNGVFSIDKAWNLENDSHGIIQNIDTIGLSEWPQSHTSVSDSQVTPKECFLGIINVQCN